MKKWLKMSLLTYRFKTSCLVAWWHPPMSLLGILSVGYSIQIRVRRSYRRAWHRGLLLHSRTQSTKERSNNNIYPSEVPSKHLPRFVSGVYKPATLLRKLMFCNDSTKILTDSDDSIMSSVRSHSVVIYYQFVKMMIKKDRWNF